MSIIENIKNLFSSPRFVSFYWQAGSVALVGFLNLIAENLGGLGIPEWLVIFIGLAIAQGTKALNNKKLGKPLGFSK